MNKLYSPSASGDRSGSRPGQQGEGAQLQDPFPEGRDMNKLVLPIGLWRQKRESAWSTG